MKIAYKLATGQTGVLKVSEGSHILGNRYIFDDVCRELKIDNSHFLNMWDAEDMEDPDFDPNQDSDRFGNHLVTCWFIMPTCKWIVVTRHSALVDYIIQEKIVWHGKFDVITHVENPEQIEGCNVVGVLPPHLAIWADSVTNIPLNVPVELRGVELTLDQVRQYAGRPFRYSVQPE